ncbi:ABC transporter ATP-binding protein [Pelotalea chapellei]|uniref:ABC transporter ATP-binding protein n=1 Tax=Pelotalea chapellei TaxID=44671 RepID=A0ABS5U5G1_9BACT|nr:ABC transporter ATP-binding protein [Pelotalea chapellei]
MSQAIVTTALSKVYREGKIEVTALASIDVALMEGEVVGLFGPSGSGKTTLLSILGCILRPTSGSLGIYGHETSILSEKDLPDIRRRFISFIFQGFNLFPALTAYENVILGLKMKGITGSDATQRATRIMAEVGLADRMKFLPRDLSGGQRQRVAVARALAADSPIILADEPTGNLDHSNGRKVMELLREMASSQQRCVIVATHDNRIEDLFDRVLYMEDGSILREKRG